MRAVNRIWLGALLFLTAGPAASRPTSPGPTAPGPHVYRARREAMLGELAVAPAGASMTFTARGPHGGPSIADQAVLLGGLLDQALTKTKPARVYFLPAANQAFTEGIAAALLHDRHWDARAGKPRAERLGPFLVSVLNRENLAKPFADVFASHGYRLTASTASRVVIGRRPGSIARVPLTISELGFDAVAR